MGPTEVQYAQYILISLETGRRALETKWRLGLSKTSIAIAFGE